MVMQRVRWALLLAGVAALPGCLAAAAAAGAGTGIYLTTRGAESTVNGTVDNVAQRTRSVFSSEGIVMDATSSESGGDKRQFKGKKGDLDITATLERQSETTTKVDVEARKNLAEWDKDYAQQLLTKIVKAGE
jgi:hypothetical protein